MAYRMAGIKGDPCDELDLVELHDAFTISDLQTYGDIGLRPYGKEEDYITSGDAYYGGRCPSNLSGGLLGTMHAVGATGIFQAWNASGSFRASTTSSTATRRCGPGTARRNRRTGSRSRFRSAGARSGFPRRRPARTSPCGILENPEEVKG